ncbi:hypothetical protein BDF20DRAFT_679063 [Mycotypha africana]|uniref:uncharacterized protein n=1 Tax=Mycotypha africana TaxID=64632 RepID=UPI00230144EB|nr:uncharacterized protein BDF20DRAFT_679063 [Mycotypha africana]KAI8971437.1 hypothetical protein BDF20DRAFT_679063 [Mycotypha africana]
MSLKSILTHYLNLENSLLTGVQHTHDESLKVVEEINPAVDASIFTRSVGNRVDVQDRAANVTFQFIPWNGGANAAETIIDRDTNLVTNDTASIFLTNKLLKDHRHMEALDSNLSKKATQLQKFESNLDSIQDKYSSEYDTYYEKLLDLKRNITLLTTQRVRVQSEVELIVQSIGDEGLNAAPHDFTITSFTIPTNCDYCKSTLWGLSKGLTCKACGFNCHTKCEMKVVPNCSKKRGQINPQPPQSLALAAGSGNRSRASSTSGSIRSPVPAISSNINIAVDSSNDHLHPSSPLTATANIVTEPAVSSSDATAITTTPTEIQSIYDYLAQNADELNLTAGDILTVVEPDDGSGWIKAQRGAEVGLVPANYIEYITNQLQQNDNDGLTYLTDSLQEGAAVGTDMTEHQLQETVVALYDFEAVNAEELDLHEGDVIIVTKKDDSGWWEVKKLHKGYLIFRHFDYSRYLRVLLLILDLSDHITCYKMTNYLASIVKYIAGDILLNTTFIQLALKHKCQFHLSSFDRKSVVLIG